MSNTDKSVSTPEENRPRTEPPAQSAPEFFHSDSVAPSAPEPVPESSASDPALAAWQKPHPDSDSPEEWLPETELSKPTEPSENADHVNPVEAVEAAAAAEPAEPAEPAESFEPLDVPETSSPANSEIPATAYRWVYEEQAAHDAAAARAKRGGSGIRVYAGVMTAVFLVSFAMLIAVLWLGRGSSSTVLRPGIPSGDNSEAVEGVERAKHSVVVIEVKTSTGGGTGTGIVMTEDGYIATNHHVIDGATEVRVTFYDGSSVSAKVVGSSEMDDLAVIKVARVGLIPAVFAYSSDCYVGQTVYAIGTPAGAEFAWTTTRGIISYKDREVKIYDKLTGLLQKKLRLLQTDANVNPGNSGGPLINEKGEVVGVVSMKLAEGYEGIGFAIPSDGALEILEAIRIYGNADSINSSVSHKRPMLGILCVKAEKGKYYVEDGQRLVEIPEEELGQYDASALIHPDVSGVLVMGITDGMDAVGKLQRGDIITAVQGIEVFTGEELSAVINDYYAGDTITLTIYRGTLYSPVDIVLSAQPDGA